MRDFLKKYVTPLSLIAFAFVGVSGLMMFFGLRNHTLNELHAWIGIAFVIIAILHIFRNDRAFTFMIRQKRSILLVAILGCIGTAAIAMSFNAPAGHGSPGRAMALLTRQMASQPLEQIAPALGLTPDEMVTRLHAGGVRVANTRQTIAQLAPQAGMAPAQMFLLVLPQGDTPPRAGAAGRGNRHRSGPQF